MKLAQKMIALATAEIGVEEVNGSNCGKRVNEYKAATWLPADKAWPWCAAFVCWLLREAMKGGTYTFERPQTAGALDFRNWSLKQDASTKTKDNPGDDIKAGDIVLFRFKTGGHIGIAIQDAKGGKVVTVEGNTDQAGSREGGGVFRKVRNTATICCRIRVNP